MSELLWMRLRELGPGASPAAVQELYAPLLERQRRDGVGSALDLSYGPHPRHVLDVYWPEAAGAVRPVLVLFHGGGFIRGDKAQRACFGYWAARAGFVAVIPNYRLAPDKRWPSGAQDVASVWTWLRARDNAERFGADPARIVLLGESAGAAHVATACLRREYQPADWQIAGAVLTSGPYNPQLEARARQQLGISTPDPRNDSYFGTDETQLAHANIVDHVDTKAFPLLITYAERDLLQMQVQAAELFARLVQQHNYSPELRCIPDHNHYSQAWSYGTDDPSLSNVVLDFARKHTRF